MCIRWPTRKERVNGSVKPDGSGCGAGTIDSAARPMAARLEVFGPYMGVGQPDGDGKDSQPEGGALNTVGEFYPWTATIV